MGVPEGNNYVPVNNTSSNSEDMQMLQQLLEQILRNLSR
jgi:hypothetical protein